MEDSLISLLDNSNTTNIQTQGNINYKTELDSRIMYSREMMVEFNILKMILLLNGSMYYLNVYISNNYDNMSINNQIILPSNILKHNNIL